MNETSPASFYIQVDDQKHGTLMPESVDSEKFIEATKETLKNAASNIKETAQTLVDKLKELPIKELEIEFGISFGAEGGIPFVTKGTIDANIKVKIKWEK